jgi:hypothetical protein
VGGNTERPEVQHEKAGGANSHPECELSPIPVPLRLQVTSSLASA